MKKLGCITLDLDPKSGNNQENIEKIRDLLKNYGVEVRCPDLSKCGDYPFVSFDFTNFKEKQSKAGRPRAKFPRIKYSELVEMRKYMTDEEIYKKLGVSRATFYRRLREISADPKRVLEDEAI